MRFLVLQHSDIAGPGRFAAILRDHGFTLDIRRPDLAPLMTPADARKHAVPPDLDNVHGLLVLGGAMNVTDIAKLPWMQQEAELIKKAHAAQMPVIGICLGCQLIGHALGGTVAPKAKPDLGFYPLAINTTGQTDTLLAGVRWTHPQLFSCGQEVTQLPPGATLLASTPTTKNACFRVGMRTLAFQFHPECDRPMCEALLDDPEHAAKAGKTAEDLKAELEEHYATYARLSDRLALNIAAFACPFQKLMAV
jgi:GMP synthase (glutamine-hydrolysing)